MFAAVIISGIGGYFISRALGPFIGWPLSFLFGYCMGRLVVWGEWL